MSGVTFFFLVLTCFSAAQEQGALGLRLLDLESAPPPIRKTNLCFGKYHWIDPRGTRSIIFSLGWLVSRFKVIEPFSLTDCPFATFDHERYFVPRFWPFWTLDVYEVPES